MEVRLRIKVGKAAGQEITLPARRFLIGREEDCDLRPRSDLVSRHHCAILNEGTYLAIRDFGSKNGTFVNGEPVNGEAELKSGDHIKVGPLEFEVLVSDPAGFDLGPSAPPAAAPAAVASTAAPVTVAPAPAQAPARATPAPQAVPVRMTPPPVAAPAPRAPAAPVAPPPAPAAPPQVAAQATPVAAPAPVGASNAHVAMPDPLGGHKKRPKVASIGEAATRTAETGSGGSSGSIESDISQWLTASETDAGSRDTRVIMPSSETDEIHGAEPAAPVDAADAPAAPVAVGPPSKLPTMNQPKATDSREAAADVLKKFFRRR